MAKIDSGSKSSRLLASRRYTHDTLTTAQESFTNVLDLRAEEIYTRAHLIPSSSLPHSGSTQFGAVYSTGGQNVTKYWYRHKLTPSNVNNETWFFINPTGSDDGVGAQLINDNQEVNFVSPKYSVATLATSTTEDATPGYLAVLYKSSAVSQSAQTSSLSGGDIVSTNDYQFDYKTGVVQFLNSDVDPTNSEYCYMSVYQYVGKTLATGLDISGNVSGSSTSTGSFGKVEATAITVSNDLTVTDDLFVDDFARIDALRVGTTSTDPGDGHAYIEGNLTVAGTLTSQEFHTEVTSGSILFTSGSTIFGDSIDDTHEITGSTTISGSLTVQSNVSGSAVSTGSFGRVEASTFSGDGSALTGVTAGALDIDAATDGTSVTVATTDLLLFSDGGTEKKMQMKQMAAPLASVISGSFTTASSSIDTRIEGIADPIAMAIALGG